MKLKQRERSTRELGNHIIQLARGFHASEYELLCEVREFDLRQGWKGFLFNNCAEWLNYYCGITVPTAREKLRTIHALLDLPMTSNAFREGHLSYSIARALTRVATPENEKELLKYALTRTASEVEDHCRQLRNADRAASTKDANEAHEERFLNYKVNGDGTVTISIELPQEQGELVKKAIEKAGREIGKGCPEVSAETSFHQRQADALVEIAAGYLSGNNQKATSTADHYQVVVHTDETALKDKFGKSDLPVESVRRLTCDCSITHVSHDKRGRVIDASRKKRVASPQLKRALLSRDGKCRYPGCHHDKWLDAHHIVHWADGGETTMDNLVLLCSAHHRLFHEGGFTIRKTTNGGYSVRTRHGRVLQDHGISEEAPVYQVSAETFPSPPINMASLSNAQRRTPYHAARAPARAGQGAFR